MKNYGHSLVKTTSDCGVVSVTSASNAKKVRGDFYKIGENY